MVLPCLARGTSSIWCQHSKDGPSARSWGKGAFGAPGVPSCVLGEQEEQGRKGPSQESADPRWAEGCYLAAFGQGKAPSQQEHDVPGHLLLHHLPVQQGWRGPELCPAPWNPKKRFCEATTIPKERENFLVGGGSLVWTSGIPSVSKLWDYLPEQTLGAPATMVLKTWLAKALMNDLCCSKKLSRRQGRVS